MEVKLKPWLKIVLSVLLVPFASAVLILVVPVAIVILAYGWVTDALK